jgi:hypothetical protein
VLSVGIARALPHPLTMHDRSAWAVALWGLLAYALLLLGHAVTDVLRDGSVPWTGPAILLVGIGLGLQSRVSFAGPARIRRDHLAELFLPDAEALGTERALPALQAADFPLAGLSTPDADGPLLLIGTGVAGASDDARFQLSPAFCGSDETGWTRTGDWLGGRLTLRDTLAISTSEVPPTSARLTTRLSWIGRALLNLRPGGCVDHPHPRLRPLGARPNLLYPGLRELLAGAGHVGARRVRLAGDGGDPLGLEALLRRRVQTIVVADATAEHEPAALRGTLLRASRDLGVTVQLSGDGDAADGFATGSITYPATADEPELHGTLLYLRAQTPPKAPGATFSAHEQLGYRLARHALMDSGAVPGHSHSIVVPRAAPPPRLDEDGALGASPGSKR